MYCKNCGAELPDDAVFCGTCGARMQEEEKRDDVYQEVPPEYSEYREAPYDSSYSGNAQYAAPQQPNAPYSGRQPNGNYTLYLVLAIVSTLLCGCTCFSLIPGVLSIIFASQINSNNKAGNYEEADKAAKRALICIIVTVALGILTIIFGFIASSAGLLTNFTDGLESYRYYQYSY